MAFVAIDKCIQMTEEESLRFSEAISDFAALIQEHGGKKVAQAFYQYYPQECKEMEGSINQVFVESRIAALFKGDLNDNQ